LPNTHPAPWIYTRTGSVAGAFCGRNILSDMLGERTHIEGRVFLQWTVPGELVNFCSKRASLLKRSMPPGSWRLI
jgi:hypothetical protein